MDEGSKTFIVYVALAPTDNMEWHHAELHKELKAQAGRFGFTVSKNSEFPPGMFKVTGTGSIDELNGAANSATGSKHDFVFVCETAEESVRLSL